MADDFDPENPFPPDKRKSFKAEHLAKYRRKPGDPPLNPTGKNGRTRAEFVAAFLDKPDETDLGQKLIVKLGLPPDTPRIAALLQRDVIAGLGSNENARRLLIEQYGGKARMQMDVTSGGRSLASHKPTTAETRQELDRVASEIGAAVAAEGEPAEKAEVGEERQPQAIEEPKEEL